MIPAEVMTVCVDIHPAVVSKLGDRGSAQSQGIVTDVGTFLVGGVCLIMAFLLMDDHGRLQGWGDWFELVYVAASAGAFGALLCGGIGRLSYGPRGGARTQGDEAPRAADDRVD